MMKVKRFGRSQPLVMAVMCLAFLGVGQGEANADEVFLAGYTNGCFNCIPPNTGGATDSDSLLGLTYVNSTFSGTTAGGFKGFGGNPAPPPTQNVNNFGAFSLTTAPNTYEPNGFSLRIAFTAPEGISGSNTAVFFALLMGTVRNDSSGGVKVDFNNNPILFTFNDTNCGVSTLPGQQTTCGSGSFLLSVNDLAIDPGQTASVTGQITAAQQAVVPEPASLLLLGSGLIAVTRRLKRSRNS